MSVCLFDRNTNYADASVINSLQKGMGELSPLSCVVTEEAGGEYELTLVHPYDATGKWRLLQRGMLIRSPVPNVYLPYVIDNNAYPLKATTDAKFYSKVETSALKEDINYILRYQADFIEWKKTKAYYAGDYVIFNVADIEHSTITRTLFRAKEDNRKIEPASEEDDDVWENLGSIFGRPVPADDGVVLATIPANEIVMRLGDMINDFVYVERANGQRGFVHMADFTIATSGGFEISYGHKKILHQFFRIYDISYNDEEKTVTVKARHVSYDNRKNGLFPCVLNDETAQNAIAKIIGKRVDISHPLNVITDSTADDITADWSLDNPVHALLDPDNGLVGKIKAKVIRDNGVFYILQNADNTHGYVIQYGKNLLGVTCTINYDEVITRVMPVANDGYDSYLFIDGLYIDADNINDYPSPRVEVLESEYYVGMEYVKANGSTVVLTEPQVLSKMTKEAQKRFSRDKVHLESIEVDVNFLMLGDADEYKQYKGMQTLGLYDTVILKTGASGLVFTNTLQVSRYEFDAIHERYNKIGLSRNVSRKRKPGSIGGHLLMNHGVSYDKLSQELKRRLKRK